MNENLASKKPTFGLWFVVSGKVKDIRIQLKKEMTVRSERTA